MVAAEPPAAVEARPWRTEDGPAPKMTCYPPGARPLLRVYTEGQWRTCPVRARADWAGGKVAYHVDVTLERGVEGTYQRAYWWDPAVMRRA